MTKLLIDKAGSVTSRVFFGGEVEVSSEPRSANVGDVVAVRAFTESITYGNLELSNGRLARINSGDVLLGVLGKRRALKGFVGDVPETIESGKRLHLLNMGGVIGECTGHHSSLTDAIELEVIGTALRSDGRVMNIGDGLTDDATGNAAIKAPVIVVAGSCMNSGKTVAAIETIKQATRAGFRAAGAKLTGIACLRDTLNMTDHGAFMTASFLDRGIPSTVDRDDLPLVAKSILGHLDAYDPDLIVAELGDGVIGGYGVESILSDAVFRDLISCLVFCANDYLGVIGGINFLEGLSICVDVVAGSVTDSKMGEDFVRERFGISAGNARRDGAALFDLIAQKCEMGVSI